MSNKKYSWKSTPLLTLTTGNLCWDHSQYFRDWEVSVLRKTINLKTLPDATADVMEKSEKTENEAVNGNFDVLKEEVTSNLDPDDIFDDLSHYSDDEYDEHWPQAKTDLKEKRKSNQKQNKKSPSKIVKQKLKKGKVTIDTEDSERVKGSNSQKESKWSRYSCDDCNVNNLSFRMYTRHLFEKHEQTLCTHCGINFEDFKVFWVHQESHKEKHICDICSNEFRSQIYLRNHKRIMHKIADEKYTNRFCQICPECGKAVDSLKQHMMLIHSSNKLQCPHCEYQTPYKNNLKNHIENKHTGGNIKNCPFCGKLVKNVKRHVLAAKCDLPEEERNNPADFVICDRCNKQFKNMERLKKHIRDIHDKPAIQCQYCKFQTKYNCNMRMHIRRVHENKPLRETCPICHKECVSIDWHIKTYHPAQMVNGFLASSTPFSIASSL